MSIENNKIIALFMDAREIRPDNFQFEPYRQLPIQAESLKYHWSWDWLMPVVEKIESLGYNTLISDFQTQISFNGRDNMQRNVVNIFSSRESSKIEEVYKAVVEFIKWYNENNQK